MTFHTGSMSDINEDASPGSTMAASASLQRTKDSILQKCSSVLLVTPMEGPSSFFPYLTPHIYEILI